MPASLHRLEPCQSYVALRAGIATPLSKARLKLPALWKSLSDLTKIIRLAGTLLLKIQHLEVLACYPVLTYINRTGAIEGPKAGYSLNI